MSINPARPNPAVMEFLLSRRSRPAKTLKTPVPDRAALMPMLEAAARSPDHGKLEPWRFVVLERDALQRLAVVAATVAGAAGADAERIEKAVAQFRDGNLAVAVIESPVITDKFPPVEQTYSAGAACLALLNAALASGWGANWLSGWISHDPDFCATALNMTPQEKIAGFIHIGTEGATPPDRPRPDLERIVTWQSA